MATGDVAPYAGQLLTEELAIDLSLKAFYCDRRITAEVEFARAKAQVDLDLERERRRIREEAKDAEIAALEKALAEVAERPVYERPWFVATATTVVIVAVVAGMKALAE